MEFLEVLFSFILSQCRNGIEICDPRDAVKHCSVDRTLPSVSGSTHFNFIPQTRGSDSFFPKHDIAQLAGAFRMTFHFICQGDRCWSRLSENLTNLGDTGSSKNF
jgi:hypothetical protein